MSAVTVDSKEKEEEEEDKKRRKKKKKKHLPPTRRTGPSIRFFPETTNPLSKVCKSITQTHLSCPLRRE